MNKAERELLDGIRDTANKYGMNSRTLLKILEAEVKRTKEAWEDHINSLPEQWFDEKHKQYVDFNSITDPLIRRE